jgi:hypothetical protein
MTIKNIGIIGNYVDIQPLKAKFTDSNYANVLTIQIISDNLTDGAVFKFWLYELVETVSKESTSYDANLIFSDTVSITGDDYSNWNGNDNTAPYVYVAGKKGIIIL